MGKPIVRREQHLLFYSNGITDNTVCSARRDLPRGGLGEGCHPILHFVCCWLTDGTLSHRKERYTVAYSLGEPKQAQMVKSPRLIAPFGPLLRAGPTDLWQPWVSVLLHLSSCWQFGAGKHIKNLQPFTH